MKVTVLSDNNGKKYLLDTGGSNLFLDNAGKLGSSSLEYFDFVFKYSDNLGKEEEHTIRDDSSLSNGCYVKTYSYRGIPVACRASVELVPKVPGTDGTTFFTHTMILDSADGGIEYFFY